MCDFASAKIVGLKAPNEPRRVDPKEASNYHTQGAGIHSRIIVT